MCSLQCPSDSNFTMFHDIIYMLNCISGNVLRSIESHSLKLFKLLTSLYCSCQTKLGLIKFFIFSKFPFFNTSSTNSIAIDLFFVKGITRTRQLHILLSILSKEITLLYFN